MKKSSESKPIHQWLDKKSGKIIYSGGGKFSSELTREMKKNLLEYHRRGEAMPFEYRKFEEYQHELEKSRNLESDDFHIIALARASGARLLYTADKKLREDFKNKNLINKPRGKIYSPKKHKQQLTKNICQIS